MSPQRTGRRRSHRREDQGPIVLEGVETLPYDLTPTEVLTEQDIQTIHNASMRLLVNTRLFFVPTLAIRAVPSLEYQAKAESLLPDSRGKDLRK